LIKGHGVDVMNMQGVKNAWENMGMVMVRRILGRKELEVFNSLVSDDTPMALNYIAKRFCAKEALFKAMGTGMRAPFDWHDAQLMNEDSGRPYFLFEGVLSVELSGKIVHVSVSDHSDIVIGSVIIEKTENV
jgi:holo-[acyl-carrier protein] synthase